MKKFKFVYCIMAIAMVTGCSKEQENLNGFENSKSGQNQLEVNEIQKVLDSKNYESRISDGTFNQYEAVLDSLYPDGYIIQEETLEVVDGGVTHLVTEVHISDGANYVLDGYFVEIPSQETAHYIDRNGDYITVYNPDDTSDTYDLTVDEYYAQYGFSPQQTETQGRPFIGSTTSDPFTEPCGECDCVFSTTTHYFFWIKIGEDTNLLNVLC